MTNKEAAMTLRLHLMNCGMLMPMDWVEANGEGSKLQEAFGIALGLLDSRNEPLSIAELRTMHEQPVWCENMGCWGIVTVEESGQWAGVPFLLGHQGCQFELNIEMRELVIYRRKPE